MLTSRTCYRYLQLLTERFAVADTTTLSLFRSLSILCLRLPFLSLLRFLTSPLQCDHSSATFFLHKQQVINQRYSSRSYLIYLNETILGCPSAETS